MTADHSSKTQQKKKKKKNPQKKKQPSSYRKLKSRFDVALTPLVWYASMGEKNLLHCFLYLKEL
jgi:hypothetical protein